MMTEITVQGQDTAAAMDEVRRLLGDDALILSTERKGRMVEIRAKDGAPDHGFAKLFSKERRNQKDLVGKKGSGADLKKALLEDQAPTSMSKSARLVPSIDAPMGGWPSLDPTAEEDIREAVEAFENDGEFVGLLKALENTLCTTTEQDILAAKRIYIIGHNAEIQADLALPLAVKLLQHRPNDILQIVLTDGISRRALAGLNTQCAFLGISTVQKSHSELAHEPSDTICEIVFLTEANAHLIGEITGKETQAILALGTGLHPKRIDQILHVTGDLYPSVVFVGLGDWIPQPEELSAIAARGSSLVWCSKTAALCDDLSPFNGETLGRWARQWVTTEEDARGEPVLTFKSRKKRVQTSEQRGGTL